jgi:hypothetical protein
MSIGIKKFRDHRLVLLGFLAGCSALSTQESTATPLPAPTADLRGQLVFAAKTAEKEDYELFLLDVKSGSIQQLTNNDFEDIAPSFHGWHSDRLFCQSQWSVRSVLA